MGTLEPAPASIFIDRRSALDPAIHFRGEQYHGKEFAILRGTGGREAQDARSVRLTRVDPARIALTLGCKELETTWISTRSQIEWLWNEAGRPVLFDAAIGLALYAKREILEGLFAHSGVKAIVFAGTIFENRLEARSDRNQWYLYLYCDLFGKWHHNISRLDELRYHPYPVATLSSCSP